MATHEINFPLFISRYNAILDRGLSLGMGARDGQMCIEAAVCAALDLPHGDDPKCVAASVRRFKIALNDKLWSSPAARAKGMRKLGIAQVGSLGVVDDKDFTRRLTEKVIRVLIPKLFRELANERADWLAAADECEREGTREMALKARDVARKYAADDAAYAYAAYAYDAADAAAYAADARSQKYDTYLTLAADLAFEVLRELGAPGVEWCAR